jgi:hypothetical protein
MNKEVEKEISEISPVFPIRKSAGRQPLPNGYFDELQKRVIKRVNEGDLRQRTKRVLINRIIRGIAAVFVIGISGWFIIQVSQGTIAPESSLALSKEDALAYALDNPFEMGLIMHEIEEHIDMTSLFSPVENNEIDSIVIDVLLDQMTLSEFDDLL